MDAVSGWIAGQLDGRMDVWTNRWVDYCLSGSMADWVDGNGWGCILNGYTDKMTY